MKCTKCGFISFDFNQVCPKCSRGLADEQRRLNLPSFRPEPPMLLARLLGEAYEEADVEIMTDQPTLMEDSFQPTGSDLEDSLGGVGDESLSFEDEEELDKITLGLEEHKSSSKEEDKEDLPDLEVSLEEPEEAVQPGELHEEDALDMLGEAGDLILEESMIEEKGKEEIGEEDISFNLDDISFEDLETEDAGLAGLEGNLAEKTGGQEDFPVVETNNFKDSGTMDSFYLDSDAEGLTKEIDMKKFKKDTDKGDKEPD